MSQAARSRPDRQILAERWGAAMGDEVATRVRSWCVSTAYGYGKGGQM